MTLPTVSLVLDYNEERQNYNINEKKILNKLYLNNDDVSIHMDTIGWLHFDECFSFEFSSLDPVGLFGEGQFNLHSMKEIALTDSFMGLDRDSRKCRNIETHDDCKTRLHIEHLRQKCGCLPLSLRLSIKVK